MARVRINSAAAEAKLKAKLVPAMAQGGLYLAGQIKQDINRGNRGGKSPSAPGEPPKKDTARLFRSITQVTAAEGREVATRVGTNVEYARPLEFGTRKMAARPFLRPALARAKDDIVRVVVAALRGGG